MEKYEFIRELGSGSYGSVKLAKDIQTKELYAIKKVKLSGLLKEERMKAEGEVKVLSSISHPNIVAYKESFHKKSSLYIVMEYIDGGDLAKIIENQRNTLMDESEILRYFVQIVQVVKYLHSNHVLHRDLKPQNIFVTKLGIVKLGDFGVAKTLDGSANLAHTMIGTPYYLSPEIWNGSLYDSKSDIWSLGCILFELCSLKKAFAATSITQLMPAIMNGRHDPIPPRYSSDMKMLVDSMLNITPQLRPTAEEISELPFIKKALTALIERNQRVLNAQIEKRQRIPQPIEQKKIARKSHLKRPSKPKNKQPKPTMLLDVDNGENDDFEGEHNPTEKIQRKSSRSNDSSTPSSNHRLLSFQTNSDDTKDQFTIDHIPSSRSYDKPSSDNTIGRTKYGQKTRLLNFLCNDETSPQKPGQNIPKWAVSRNPSKRVQPTFGVQTEQQTQNIFEISDDDNAILSDDFNNQFEQNENIFEDDFIDDKDDDNNFNADDFMDDDFIHSSDSDELHELERANCAMRESLQGLPWNQNKHYPKIKTSFLEVQKDEQIQHGSSKLLTNLNTRSKSAKSIKLAINDINGSREMKSLTLNKNVLSSQKDFDEDNGDFNFSDGKSD